MSRDRGAVTVGATAPRVQTAACATARDAPLGGQAVLEGVMMRGVSTWAVAVRKPPDENEPRRARSA